MLRLWKQNDDWDDFDDTYEEDWEEGADFDATRAMIERMLLREMRGREWETQINRGLRYFFEAGVRNALQNLLGDSASVELISWEMDMENYELAITPEEAEDMWEAWSSLAERNDEVQVPWEYKNIIATYKISMEISPQREPIQMLLTTPTSFECKITFYPQLTEGLEEKVGNIEVYPHSVMLEDTVTIVALYPPPPTSVSVKLENYHLAKISGDIDFQNLPAAVNLETIKNLANIIKVFALANYNRGEILTLVRSFWKEALKKLSTMFPQTQVTITRHPTLSSVSLEKDNNIYINFTGEISALTARGNVRFPTTIGVADDRGKRIILVVRVADPHNPQKEEVVYLTLEIQKMGNKRIISITPERIKDRHIEELHNAIQKLIRGASTTYRPH